MLDHVIVGGGKLCFKETAICHFKKKQKKNPEHVHSRAGEAGCTTAKELKKDTEKKA